MKRHFVECDSWRSKKDSTSYNTNIEEENNDGRATIWSDTIFTVKDWASPSVNEWGMERPLNDALRDKYKKIEFCVNQYYCCKKELEKDQNCMTKRSYVTGVEGMLRYWMDGEGEVRTIWAEIELACGIIYPMPPSLLAAVNAILGIYVPTRARKLNLKTIPKVTSQDVFLPLSVEEIGIPPDLATVRLNVTLFKIYVAMTTLVNQYWLRFQMDFLAPPTVFVETSALVERIRLMRMLTQSVIEHVEILGSQPFVMPKRLVRAVNKIAPVNASAQLFLETNTPHS